MKTRQMAFAAFVVAAVAVFGCSVIFTESDAADQATLEDVTVDSVVEFNGAVGVMDIHGKNITFTGDGKYVFNDGSILNVGILDLGIMKVNFQINGSSDSVIVLKEGSIVSAFAMHYVVPADMTIGVDGSVNVVGSIDMSKGIGANIDVDISNGGALSVAGVKLTGGEGKELSANISTDLATKLAITLSLDVPEMSGEMTLPENATIPGGVEIPDFGKMTFSAKDAEINLKADIDIKTGEATITGINGGDAIMSVAECTYSVEASAGDQPMTITATVKNSKLSFNGTGGEDIRINFDASVESIVVKITSTSGIIQMDAQINDVSMDAALIISDSMSTFAVVGTDSDKACFKIGSATITGGMEATYGDDKVGMTIDASLKDVDIDMSLVADKTSTKPDMDIAVTFGSLDLKATQTINSQKNEASFGFSGLDINAKYDSDKDELTVSGKLSRIYADSDIKLPIVKRITSVSVLQYLRSADARDVEMSMTMDLSTGSYTEVRMSVGSFEGKFNIDAMKVSASGSDISMEMDLNDEYTIKVGSLSATAEAPYEDVQRATIDATDLYIDTDSGASVKKVTMDMTYPDKSVGKYVITDYKVSAEESSGSISISGINENNALSMSIQKGIDYSIEDCYVENLLMDEGASVDGNIIVIAGGSVYDAADNAFDSSTANGGVNIEMTLENGIIKSAVATLKPGYESIPTWSTGLKYDLNGTTEATFTEFDGNAVVDAVAKTYTVTADGKEYKLMFDDYLNDIADPAQAPTGCEFYGWFDGTSTYISGESYTLTVPADVTLQPLWVLTDTTGTVTDKTYNIDASVSTGLFLDDARVASLVDEMIDKDIDTLVVKTDGGNVAISAYDLMFVQRISINFFEATPADPVVAEVTSGKTVYNIEVNTSSPYIGALSNDIAKFTITHKLASGENADNLSVYNVNKYGRVVELDDVVVKDNGDGTVDLTFSPLNDGYAGDFGGYYVDIASESGDNGGDLPIAMIAGILVVIVLIAALIFLVVKRRNAGA